MAKPEHTAYQIQVDFSGIAGSHVGIVGVDTTCTANNTLKAGRNYGPNGQRYNILCCALDDAVIHFGLNHANSLLSELRNHAKLQFKKGERPTFFLRKLTMTEFLDHKNFKKHKDNSVVKVVFKKYLLMGLLREKGYQMS